jgi:hypothetical protein
LNQNKEQKKRDVNLFINEQCDYNAVVECKVRDVEGEKVCVCPTKDDDGSYLRSRKKEKK